MVSNKKYLTPLPEIPVTNISELSICKGILPEHTSFLSLSTELIYTRICDVSMDWLTIIVIVVIMIACHVTIWCLFDILIKEKNSRA